MFILEHITNQLLARLQYMKVNSGRILAWQCPNAVSSLKAIYSNAVVEADATGEPDDLIVGVQAVAASPEAVAQAWRHVCKPDGCLIFASFGPDTLNGVVEEPFVDLHTWGDALLKAGWQDPVTDRQTLNFTYDDGAILQQDFAPFFAMGKTDLKSDVHFPVELIIGHAWGTDRSITTSENEVVVPISSIQKR